MTLDLVWVEVLGLICLSEGVMVSDTISVISKATEVGLRPLLLFNGDSDNLDLVVSKSDFDLKLVGHDELISLNGVVVVLLLLSHLLVAFLLLHHLLLHLLLLELL